MKAVEIGLITLVGGIAFVLLIFGITRTSKDLFQEQSTDATRVYKSTNGYFSIELPIEIRMIENEEIEDLGQVMYDLGGTFNGKLVRGEVEFTFKTHNENRWNGLAIIYGKPFIDGQGGACPSGIEGDENEDDYRTEVFAGQEVSVCENEEGRYFRAEYFAHPTKDIDYWITIHGPDLSTEQYEILRNAIKNTLKFETE